jgi:hypothetical protein
MSEAAKQVVPANTIGAVKIDKVYPVVLRENYSAHLNAAAPKKIDAVAKGLEEHFAKVAKEKNEELVQCDICEGWSPEDLVSCPFCNDGVEANAAPSPVHPPVSTLAKVEAAVTTAPALVHELSGRPDSSKGMSPEERYARKLEEFKAHTHDAAASFGHACEVLQELERDWALSPHAKAHKSFARFASAELHLGRARVYEMLAVAQRGLAPHAEALGVETTRLLAAAPADKVDELREKASGGATTRQLKAEISALKNGGDAAAKKAKHEAKEKLARDGAAVVAAHKSRGAITVVLGEHHVVAALEKAKRGAFEGALDAENGVTIRFRLVPAKGERVGAWDLEVRAERDDDSAGAEAAQ